MKAIPTLIQPKVPCPNMLLCRQSLSLKNICVNTLRIHKSHNSSYEGSCKQNFTQMRYSPRVLYSLRPFLSSLMIVMQKSQKHLKQEVDLLQSLAQGI